MCWVVLQLGRMSTLLMVHSFHLVRQQCVIYLACRDLPKVWKPQGLLHADADTLCR